jgi:hypothetical protein
MLEIYSGIVILLFAVFVIFGAIPSVAVPYAVLRMRDTTGENHDPQLGLKVGYHFFFSLGVLMIQLGLTVNVADLLIDDNNAAAAAQFRPGFAPQPLRAPRTDSRLLTPAMRIGWAVAASGLVFAVVFGATSILGTNVRRFPAVRRVFAGWRMMVAGLAVVSAVTVLIVWLFLKDKPDNKMFEIALATLAIWAPSLAVHVFLMQRYNKKEYYVPPKSKVKPPVVEEDEEDDEDDD